MPTPGQGPEALDLVDAGGAETVAHVAHTELAEPRTHHVEASVGSVLEEEMDVHADGVAESARRLSGHERLIGGARRRGRAENRTQQKNGQKTAKAHDCPALAVFEQMHVDEEGA